MAAPYGGMKEAMDTKGKFYLGRIFDLKKGKTSDQALLYDPEDLTTHAVVVGMTGSGKTGLCIDLLEEAALNGIPALMIDPKGDITNALLHFPDLLPQDFKDWVNPDQARREGKTIEQAAAEAAENWKKGLADWGIGEERLRALESAANFAVYTPGSDAGIPINILASLKAPDLAWEGNEELLREKISSTTTAILGLVGLTDLDPVQSREHILLSNIFETSWSKGQDLALDELIMQTQTPPFQKLGVFDINSFFPQKERFELAMKLNNILAAPAFQTWISGQPLDIPSLLYGQNGRPNHSVFYISHLNDEERMFFITLLFSAIEAWMRSQSGTKSLRALVYFDEIFGYIPPVSNPPSKGPMLRMLKTARAFGVGLILVTQNPVDLDYKGLSNTGTWFVGKLQTDQDKQRLLDGLEGALAGAMNRSYYDKLISGLGKRVFLMHNVHNKEPILFQTRWAMNYLAGPLTRTQISTLNTLVGARFLSTTTGSHSKPPTSTTTEQKPQSVTEKESPTGKRRETPGSTTRSAVPSGIEEYFLPSNLTLDEGFKTLGKASPSGAINKGLLYHPTIIAQANIRFLKRNYNLDHELIQTRLVIDPDRRGIIRWEEHASDNIDRSQLDDRPDSEAVFSSLVSPMSEVKLLTSIQKDFIEWVYQTSEVNVRANETLKIFCGPEVSNAEFRRMCTEAARKERESELKKLNTAIDRKIDALQNKLSREQRELDEDKTKLSQRRIEELGTHAETIISFFGKRRSTRRISSSLTKRRMAAEAKADVEESVDAIAEYTEQIAELEKEKLQTAEEVNQRWGEIANQVSEIPVTPLKKDVMVELFGIAWFPYYLVKVGDKENEVPAFQHLVGSNPT